MDTSAFHGTGTNFFLSTYYFSCQYRSTKCSTFVFKFIKTTNVTTNNLPVHIYHRGHAVTQLVEALSYKPEGRGFDSRWCYWNFGIPSSRTLALGLTQPLTEMSTGIFPGDKGGRCVGLTTLPPLCAYCLEIWEPQPPEPSGPVKACNGIALPYHTTLSHNWTSPTTDSLLHRVKWHGLTWFCKIHANIREVTSIAFWTFHHSTLFSVLKRTKREIQRTKTLLPSDIFTNSIEKGPLCENNIRLTSPELPHFHGTKISLPRNNNEHQLVHYRDVTRNSHWFITALYERTATSSLPPYNQGPPLIQYCAITREVHWFITAL
jgi:hypothetical protein